MNLHVHTGCKAVRISLLAGGVGGGGGLIRAGVQSVQSTRRKFYYFLKTLANVSSSVIMITVVMLKGQMNQKFDIFYFNSILVKCV